MSRIVSALALLAVIGLAACDKQSPTNQDRSTASSTPAPGAENAAPATPAAGSTAGQTASAHKASGTIEAVDPVAGTLRINHGPVASLSWPSMTMDFGVSDKGLLNNVKSGQQVEFEFIERGTDYVVTAIR